MVQSHFFTDIENKFAAGFVCDFGIGIKVALSVLKKNDGTLQGSASVYNHISASAEPVLRVQEAYDVQEFSVCAFDLMLKVSRSVADYVKNNTFGQLAKDVQLDTFDPLYSALYNELFKVF